MNYDTNQLQTSTLKKRLLLVDDDQDWLDLLKEVLKKKFEVVCFCDPTEALEALRREQFSVVCTDINMPQITGFEIILEAYLRQKGVAVIAITGQTEFSSEEKNFFEFYNVKLYSKNGFYLEHFLEFIISLN